MPPFGLIEHADFQFISTPEFGSANYLFPLSNGVQLPFGAIVAIAGDYTGVADAPICLDDNLDNQEQRFWNAFKTLDEGDAEEIKKLLQLIQNERKSVDQSVYHGHTESHAVGCYALHETIDSLEDTKDKYLALADHNLDHFGQDGLVAFRAGHRVAMKTALAASQLSVEADRLKQLELAFKLEAFACHFLSDQFAAGHTRVPRRQLNETFGSHIGSLLTLLQHNEDGDEGLMIMDGQQHTWMAKGDGHFFESDSEDNQTQARAAVKTALEEIHQVYQQQLIPDKSLVLPLIPKPTATNFSPLFSFKGKNDKGENELFYRAKLDDLKGEEYRPLTHQAVLTILGHQAVKYVKNSAMVGKIEQAAAAIKTDLRDLSRVSSTPATTFQPAPKTTRVPVEEPASTHCHCALL